MTSSEIRSTARQSLTNKWGKAALIAFCYFLIEFLINFMISGAKGSLPLLSSLLSIGNTVISVPLAYGFLISFMKLKRGEEVNAFDFFADGFSNFGRAWGITWGIIKKLLVPIIIIIVLYIVLIASSVSLIAFSSTLFKSYSASASITAGFLSIICSIGLIALYIWIAIKSLFYVLVYQVAYDNPNLSSKEVVEESERLMTGNRGKYFVLQLSFIGWAILACLALGIGMFWLTPYITVATICFYEALSGKSDTTIEVDSEEIK